MANTQLDDLTGLAVVAAGDLLYIVDVSDTTDSAQGSSRKITASDLMGQAAVLNSSLATLTGSQTLTNKSVNLANNTLTGTTAEFNTALSDGNFATQAGTETLTNKTLTAPKFADGGFIADPNGNEILEFDNVAAAVNHIYILNSATGNKPYVISKGGDSNVGLGLSSKGTGSVEIGTNDGGTPVAYFKNSTDISLAGSTANIQVSDADPWRTIWIPAGVLKPTTTAGCASVSTIEAGTNDIDYDVLGFDTSTDENAFANFQMPASYDGGAIQFRFIWTASGGGSGQTAVMELSGRAIADDGAIDQAVGTPIEVSDTWLADGDIHISSWSSDVTLAGSPAGGQWVHLELMRDVSEDNLAVDARILGISIRYKQGQFTD